MKTPPDVKINLPPAEHRELKALAALAGKTLNRLIREMVLKAHQDAKTAGAPVPGTKTAGL